MDSVHKVRFWLGEKFFRLGLMLQEQVEDYVLGVKSPSPHQILEALLDRNKQKLLTRPLKSHKPVGIIITCIDHRIDWSIVSGDARDCFDIVRLPGSVLTDEVIETIYMAVKEHKVKMVMVTEHSNCAMEKIASMGSSAPSHYKSLCNFMGRKSEQTKKLLSNSLINERILSGELIFVRAHLDTFSREIQVKAIVDKHNLLKHTDAQYFETAGNA